MGTNLHGFLSLIQTGCYVNRAGCKGVWAGRELVRAGCSTLRNMPSWNTVIVAIAHTLPISTNYTTIYRGDVAIAHCHPKRTQSNERRREAVTCQLEFNIRLPQMPSYDVIPCVVNMCIVSVTQLITSCCLRDEITTFHRRSVLMTSLYSP